VRRWHSRQWHIETRAGSPSMSRRSCPQLQAAVRVVMGQAPRPSRRVILTGTDDHWTVPQRPWTGRRTF